MIHNALMVLLMLIWYLYACKIDIEYRLKRCPNKMNMEYRSQHFLYHPSSIIILF